MLSQPTIITSRKQMILKIVFVLVCAFGTVTNAAAQRITPPPTPTAITPPAGNSAFLVGHAEGTQGYVCLPTSTGGTSWTINAARPEATLFTKFFGQDVQIITHFTSINANPNENATSRCPWVATRRGRVRSIPARCGQKRWERSSPGPTPRVAPTLARFPASCCSQSGTKRGQRAVNSWPIPPSSNA